MTSIPRTTGGCAPSRLRGPNIGLIGSLASYARVNRYGFIETPYRKVVKGKVARPSITSPLPKRSGVIAQANAPLNPDGSYQRDRCWCAAPVARSTR